MHSIKVKLGILVPQLINQFANMLWTQSCILRYVNFTIQSIIWQAFHVSLQNMVLKPASRKLYGTGALKTNDNHHKTQTPQNA